MAAAFSDRSELDAWLRRDVDNRVAWEQVRQRWDDLGLLLREERFDAMAAEALTAPEPRGMPEVGRFLAATAGLFLLVVVALAGGRMLYPPATEYATADESRVVQLADGSQVHLDYHSHLRVRFNWRGRNLRLRQGRALFEVAHDARRPFEVRAGAARVVATGTRFEVEHDAGDVSVALLSGVVQVRAEDDPAPTRMQPGTRLRWQPDRGAWYRTRIDVEAAASWTRGFLQFNDTPLVEAVREINRYGSRPIELTDSALGTLRVSGDFKRGEGARFAAALPHVLPVETRVEADRIMVTPR